MSSYKNIQKNYVSIYKQFIGNTLKNLEIVLNQTLNLKKGKINKIKKLFKMQLNFDFNSYNNSKLIIDKLTRNLIEGELELQLSKITNSKVEDCNDIFDLLELNKISTNYSDENSDSEMYVY